MATVGYTRVQPGVGEDIPTGVVIYEWNLAGATDDGVPVSVPHFSGKVAQQLAGTTGSVQMQGSLNLKSETPNWAVLNDPQGGPIALTANKIEQILEDCVLVRPVNSVAASVVRIMVTTPARR